MARFEYNDYNEHFVMHCPTLESSDIFLRHLDSIGKTWCSGTKYTEYNPWSDYEENTCYLFVPGEYSDLDYFESEEEYEILEFYDFDWEEPEVEITIPFDAILYGVTEVIGDEV